jgi:hypothetical protein
MSRSALRPHRPGSEVGDAVPTGTDAVSPFDRGPRSPSAAALKAVTGVHEPVRRPRLGVGAV